ncbi:alpha/beta fold hydrolase [Acinetobacter sp. WZC-1]|uniref:alpha/beta fold hydrolase n=1 Tax=Acinetobacter sp. WZC-1 TaxID=3459034 RepID=UPI00403DC0F9
MEALPQLIFLPGASGSTRFWQPVMQALPARFLKTVIAYPGFGGHTADPQLGGFSDLQHKVIAQIQEPAIVIAQSMGGILAVQSALQKPQLIRGLVLVATSGGIDLSAFELKDWRHEYQQALQVPDWFVQHHEYLDDQLHRIHCPVLLLWGDRDPISPVAVGQYLESKISHSRLEIIADGAHDLAKVHTDQVSAFITAFIEDNILQ